MLLEGEVAPHQAIHCCVFVVKLRWRASCQAEGGGVVAEDPEEFMLGQLPARRARIKAADGGKTLASGTGKEKLFDEKVAEESGDDEEEEGKVLSFPIPLLLLPIHTSTTLIASKSAVNSIWEDASSPTMLP